MKLTPKQERLVENKLRKLMKEAESFDPNTTEELIYFIDTIVNKCNWLKLKLTKNTLKPQELAMAVQAIERFTQELTLRK